MEAVLEEREDRERVVLVLGVVDVKRGFLAPAQRARG